MSDKKPDPIQRPKQRDPCPVCGEPSYSAAGIHPQCAVSRADTIRKAELDAIKKENLAKGLGKPVVGRWQKECPGCEKIQHVRVKKCSCGHEFPKSIGSRSSNAPE